METGIVTKSLLLFYDKKALRTNLRYSCFGSRSNAYSFSRILTDVSEWSVSLFLVIDNLIGCRAEIPRYLLSMPATVAPSSNGDRTH